MQSWNPLLKFVAAGGTVAVIRKHAATYAKTAITCSIHIVERHVRVNLHTVMSLLVYSWMYFIIIDM